MIEDSTRSSRKSFAKAKTPIAFVNAVVKAYEIYGRDPARALAQGQIPPQMLNDAAAHVTSSQFEALCTTAMRELDDEALGWFSRRLPWGTYGLLCRASLTSVNLGIALKRWCRHHKLLTDSVELQLNVKGDFASVQLIERDIAPDLREFCIVTLFRYLMGYLSWLIDSKFVLIETGFAFAEPQHRGLYDILFPGVLNFSGQKNFICFPAKYLDMAVRRDEKALQLMLHRALPLTINPYRSDRATTLRVEQLIKNPASFAPSAAKIADALHVSSRTLHRKLLQEGTSLRLIKEQARQHQAKDLLLRTRKTLKQIATAIGFRNEKSFSRAFRLWTNETPDAFRKRFQTSKTGE